MSEAISYLLTLALIVVCGVVAGLAGPGIVSGLAIGSLGTGAWFLGNIVRE